VILFFMLVRWSWPRFRFDQLMALAWKVMLPLGMVNLVVIAVLVEFQPQLIERAGGRGAASLLMIGASWLIGVLCWAAVAWAAPLGTDNRPVYGKIGAME
jgi:NADH-quinone oxidoreductase subunit H